ncbi:MAG: cobalamin biosynthesis protein CobW [Ruminococcaceae bacterium]|nr:cobalamin biosynthesis protein CobW [Oscillospiraceae bacterium]
MTKIDIYSGFLGAGKTTLIKKMIKEAYAGEKLVLIENEFGEIGIDGGFLQDAGINITEMNSGCICCSLVGDFGKALTQVIDEYHPDRIVIEPSGVGKLSDVIAAVEKVTGEDVTLGHTVAVADAGKVKVYMKNFGEFYNNQIETASTIILSRTDSVPQAKLDLAVALIREHNAHAVLVITPWDQLTGQQLLEAMEGGDSLQKHMEELEHEHHHHHHDEEHHCCCGGHHHDHEHHHEHGEHCGCGHHHDHGHHHADEVFTSWGVETARKFTVGEIEEALHCLDTGRYGMVLRAKGIVACADGGWIHFDYVPEEHNVRMGSASVMGKLCVIGSNLQEQDVAKLFGV